MSIPKGQWPRVLRVIVETHGSQISGPNQRRLLAHAEDLGLFASCDTPEEMADHLGDFYSGLKAAGDAAFADFGVRFFVLPNPMYGSWQ